MTEETKNEIISQIEKFKMATPDEKRFCMAGEIVDRLFVANYFCLDDMASFIKNELTSVFNLSEKETEIILSEYKNKEKIINDRIQLAQLKNFLQDIPIYEHEITQCLNFGQCKIIAKYIVKNMEIYNTQLLKDFVMNDLAEHFKIKKEEKMELERMLKNEFKDIEKKNI